MTLIDIHCHTIPKGFCQYIEKFNSAGTYPAIVSKDNVTSKVFDGGKFQLTLNESIFYPEVILSRMDDARVDLALISGSPDPGFLAAEFQPEACQVLNDSVAEIISRTPDRFRGIGVLPWPCPEEAAKEAVRIKAMGFKGVMLYSHCGPLLVDDPLMDATYKVCQDLELPLSMHPDVPLWYDYVNNYGLVTNVSFVIDTSLSLLRMIYSGVFDRFPKLKLVMPHAGGILPYLDGRLSYTPPDYRRFVPQDKKRPPEYLKSNNIWYDISNPSIAVLKMIKDYAGTDRLMFGSDYPSVEHQYLLDLIGQVGFSESELENIKWRNAEKLYGPLL